MKRAKQQTELIRKFLKVLCLQVMLFLVATAGVVYAQGTGVGAGTTLAVPAAIVNPCRIVLGILGIGLLADGLRKLGEGKGGELIAAVVAIGLAVALPYILTMFGIQIV